MACNPWKLVNTATIFLAVLSSYSVFLGPMTGLMISSYFIINRRRIKVDDLFIGNSLSIYWYTCGLNWRAAVAVRACLSLPCNLHNEINYEFANLSQWFCGTVPSLPGFVAYVNPKVNVPAGLMHLYYICFIVGLAISATVYCTLHTLFPVSSITNFVDFAPPPAALMDEYRERWDRDDYDVEAEKL